MHSAFRLLFLIPFLLAGCGSWTSPIDKLSPYQVDVQQGNAITQDMIDKLKPGMTPAQVRFILGTPLITDPFHPERWDYVYRYLKAGRITEQRRITVVFEGEKLKRVEGDVVAAQAPETRPEVRPAAEGAAK